MLFLKPITFLQGAVGIDSLPPYQLPEVAFAGRSNVGKSSLINALVGRSGVARASNTPGRTQEINFFDLGGRMTLVDLPGYGFAQAPKDKVERWTRLVQGFLKGRPVLRRVALLVDSRHGLKDTDIEMMAMLDKAAVVYQVVLTKTDKLRGDAFERVLSDTQNKIAKRIAAYPTIISTSAEKGVGIPELRMELAELATPEHTS